MHLGAMYCGKWNFLSLFYKASDLCTLGGLHPPISPLVHVDRQAQHTRRHTQRHLQFLSKAALLIHTQALTVQQSIFSEGWPPSRTSRQSEGAPAMKGPVIAFDRSPYKDVVHQMPTDKKPSTKS